MTLLVIIPPSFTRCLRIFSQGTTVRTSLIVGVFFLLIIGSAFADSTVPTTENDYPLLDSTQKQASTMLLNAAYWLDDFFSDDRVISEENKTRVKLELGFGYSRNDTFEIKPTISGRIDLPHFSKKLNLLVFASRNNDFDSEQNPISVHTGVARDQISSKLPQGCSISCRKGKNIISLQY